MSAKEKSSEKAREKPMGGGRKVSRRGFTSAASATVAAPSFLASTASVAVPALDLAELTAAIEAALPFSATMKGSLAKIAEATSFGAIHNLNADAAANIVAAGNSYCSAWQAYETVVGTSGTQLVDLAIITNCENRNLIRTGISDGLCKAHGLDPRTFRQVLAKEVPAEVIDTMNGELVSQIFTGGINKSRNGLIQLHELALRANNQTLANEAIKGLQQLSVKAAEQGIELSPTISAEDRTYAREELVEAEKRYNQEMAVSKILDAPHHVENDADHVRELRKMAENLAAFPTAIVNHVLAQRNKGSKALA